jgi:hypothetical protein
VAKVTGRLELHLYSPYTLPLRGQEKLLRLSFTIDVEQLIELLKHFSTALSAGMKKPLKYAKEATQNAAI